MRIHGFYHPSDHTFKGSRLHFPATCTSEGIGLISTPRRSFLAGVRSKPPFITLSAKSISWLPQMPQLNPARQIQTGKRIHARREVWDLLAVPLPGSFFISGNHGGEEVPLSGLFRFLFPLPCDFQRYSCTVPRPSCRQDWTWKGRAENKLPVAKGRKMGHQKKSRPSGGNPIKESQDEKSPNPFLRQPAFLHTGQVMCRKCPVPSVALQAKARGRPDHRPAAHRMRPSFIPRAFPTLFG